MPYRNRKKGLKAIIKREINKNEDKKVEKKRFLGLLGADFDNTGRIWSIFGQQNGLQGGDTPDAPFYLTLFNGTSATGTNQLEDDPSLPNVAIRNFPSNYNIAMIGDELYLENLYLKYRIYKTATAAAGNVTCRVMCLETYNPIDPSIAFELNAIFEYQHFDYTVGGVPWNGSILSSINRRIVKRVFHDRTLVVNNTGTLGGVKTESIHLKLNRKLIATNKGLGPASGMNMTAVISPGGTVSVPHAATYAQQKVLRTPHIYFIVLNDQSDDDDEQTAIQSCWSLKYTDM